VKPAHQQIHLLDYRLPAQVGHVLRQLHEESTHRPVYRLAYTQVSGRQYDISVEKTRSQLTVNTI
jgi:hypothetical protein